jgi:transglutaminase/protease-like cytokinesis protein 3
MRTLLLLFLLITTQLSFSQDYKSVDSIVKNYPKAFKSIEKFAKKIESDFTTDIEKTRAAYYWISNNVSYDYKSANSVRSSGYHYYDDSELKKVQLEYAENVLKEKKSVCEGYSQLLKYVLEQLEVKCEVIDGYAKTEVKEIGKIKNEENHAWNAVYLNEKWQLIDATWSTGNEENNPGYFNFNDAYFLIRPEYLIWSHFPDDKKWQLIKKPISNLAFFYSPIFHSGFYNSGLELTKMKGIIKSNRTIQLSFDSIDTDKTYYYQYTESSFNLEPIEFIKKGNKQIAEIPYSYKNGKELTIFNGFKACLSFKII